MPSVYCDVQTAYLDQLRLTLDRPDFINAPRGQRSRERLGVSFSVANPVQRHVSIPARRANIVFNFAEGLWYLAGRCDVGFISYYAPSIVRFSKSGDILEGTAYGPRIFAYGPRAVNQWQSVLATLADDRDSKRAVISIFDPHELLVPDNIDVACTLGLQFFIREHHLHAHAYMRANDGFRGLVSDIFSFTLIQEVLAAELGLAVGPFTHSVGSFHIYHQDERWAREVLDADAAVCAGPPAAFPSMPSGDNWPYIRQVLDWEERLRCGTAQLTRDALLAIGLPEYWGHVLAMFELYRELCQKEPIDPQLYEYVPLVYQGMLRNRWPDVFSVCAEADISAGGVAVPKEHL